MFHSNFSHSIKHSIIDNEGRYIIVDLKIDDQVYTCVNIYAPNDDCPQFFREIDSILDQFQCNKIIYGGDFNFVFNLVLDKKGGIKRTNFKA